MRWPERYAGQMADALAADVQRGAEVIRKLVLIAQGRACVREQIDLNEIVLEHRIPFADPGPRVLTMLAPGPCRVHGDREALMQVVAGLVANAIDYSPVSGQVILRTCCDNGTVYLEVTDRGPGIPESIREKIYDPFFTTRRAEGHDGLGLSVASAVIAAHGGRLELETSATRGTTFRVMLPASTASRGSKGRNGTRKLR
ncbi:MAG: sensor histidine kinase [Acidobacteria bacterium]|nr:sensor histidine kinase [Acidobacteriota bacterium]